MKFVPGMLKNSQGVIMVIAICILLAITALGIGMVTNAAMSSTIAKNYKNRIQSFYAADGQMTKIAQSVIDSTDSGWTAVGGGISNLITNGDFSSSGTGWTLGNPTYGTVDYSSGYADVTITNAAGATYQPQMMSDPISVKLNTTYTVCFDIKASAARTVNVSLYNGSFLGLNVSGVPVRLPFPEKPIEWPDRF